MTGTFDQPDHTGNNGTAYKTQIDNSISALSRIGQAYAPHEHATPQMKVTLDAGAVFDNISNTLDEVAQQSTATITAPTGNPRIDRVVIDTSGAVSVITGAEAASPTAPNITDGKYPVCQVALSVGQTTITNTNITDERVMIPINSLKLKGSFEITDDSTYRHYRSGTDFIFSGVNGGDILQMVDAGAPDANGANPYFEFSFTTALGGSLTRLGYVGYGSGSTANLFLNNDTSGGNIVLNPGAGGICELQDGADVGGALSVDDTLDVGDDLTITDGELYIINSGGGGSGFLIQQFSNNNVVIDNADGGSVLHRINGSTKLSLFSSEFQVDTTTIDLNGTIDSSTGQVASVVCKFDGTAGSLSTDIDHNVASLTDNGSGDYSVNFDNTLSSEYAVSCLGKYGSMPGISGGTAPSSSACRIAFKLDDGGATDGDYISFLAFSQE